MRVALICHDFPPFAYGGVASSCFDLAHNLLRGGIEVEVFCGHRKATSLEFYDDLKVTGLRSNALAPRLSFVFSNLALLPTLLGETDVVHVFSSLGPLVDRIRTRVGKPVLSNIHSIPYRAFKAFAFSPVSSWTLGDLASDFLEFPISHIITKWTLDKSDHIVVPSSHALEDLLSSYSVSANRFSIIPNGVDFSAPYYKVSANALRGDESSSIVYCGRLTWIKGITFLVKAFSILARKIENAHLSIVGWGPLGPSVKNLVSALGLSSRVHFLGAVSRERAVEELSRSSFLVLPSLNENGPVVAYEAMGLAKPVIAFDFSFAREFVFDNHNGLLARAYDIKDLSNKMLTLLTDKELLSRLGNNAYDYAKKKHDWAINVKKYVEIYKHLLSRGH